MIKAGVIGHPIAHSLSPKIHNYWLKKYSINGEYKAYDVAENQLDDFVKSLAKNGFSGCNVTIPHKEKILPLLDEIDKTAAKVEAVNTIIIRNGKIFGTNSDVYGFRENIKYSISKKNKAFILGAGGAAKAVVLALKELGFSEIIISNRTEARALELSEKHNLRVVKWNEKDKNLSEIDLLVNTTSLGLTGNSELEINLAALPLSAIVTDIVYKPLITPLLAAAQLRGNKIIDGLGMLINQAAIGFSEWFGVFPEVDNELRHHIMQET